MQRFETQSAATSALVARIISNEVDMFMDGNIHALDQKSLKQLEKDIEKIL